MRRSNLPRPALYCEGTWCSCGEYDIGAGTDKIWLDTKTRRIYNTWRCRSHSYWKRDEESGGIAINQETGYYETSDEHGTPDGKLPKGTENHERISTKKAHGLYRNGKLAQSPDHGQPKKPFPLNLLE